MAGDTTASETSDAGSCSESEYMTTDEEPLTRHFAVNSSDFRRAAVEGMQDNHHPAEGDILHPAHGMG